jgi:hypothetical protein
MSDVETSIQKPKRVYKKKIVEPVVQPIVEPVPEPVPEPVSEKPKRKYTPRKPKAVRGSASSPTLSDVEQPRKRKYTPRKPKEPTPEPTIPFPDPIPAPEPQSSSDEDTPAPVVKEKRPRTEKQIAAFNKMREARLKKQAELEHLKEIAKHQTLLDKEQKKLEKVEDQIIKKKAARKPRVTSSDAGLASERRKKEVVEDYLEQYVSEPESFKVPTLKPILFM